MNGAKLFTVSVGWYTLSGCVIGAVVAFTSILLLTAVTALTMLDSAPGASILIHTSNIFLGTIIGTFALSIFGVPIGSGLGALSGIGQGFLFFAVARRRFKLIENIGSYRRTMRVISLVNALIINGLLFGSLALMGGSLISLRVWGLLIFVPSALSMGASHFMLEWYQDELLDLPDRPTFADYLRTSEQNK